MKASRAFGIVAAVIIAGWLPEAGAVTRPVAVKVTIEHQLSVSLSATTLSLPPIKLGGTHQSSSGVGVKNGGSGPDITLSLSLKNPLDWTAGTSPGTEVYVLNAAFDADGASITWDPAKHALSTTPVKASATRFAGDQTGAQIPFDATRTLRFQFKAPTASTTTRSQSIEVIVTAELP